MFVLLTSVAILLLSILCVMVIFDDVISLTSIVQYKKRFILVVDDKYFESIKIHIKSSYFCFASIIISHYFRISRFL